MPEKAARPDLAHLRARQKAEMADPHAVVLAVATSADATLLSNLLELYIHDLSPAFPEHRTRARRTLRLSAAGALLVGTRAPISVPHPVRRPGRGIRARHAGLTRVRGPGCLRRRRVFRASPLPALRRGPPSEVSAVESSSWQVVGARFRGEPGGSAVLGRCDRRVHGRRGNRGSSVRAIRMRGGCSRSPPSPVPADDVRLCNPSRAACVVVHEEERSPC